MGLFFINSFNCLFPGIAGAQPGRETTIDAQAEPRITEAFKSNPAAMEDNMPAIKLSPAPLGLTAVVGKILVRISSLL